MEPDEYRRDFDPKRLGSSPMPPRNSIV